jgi:hypothetical protein
MQMQIGMTGPGVMGPYAYIGVAKTGEYPL